MNNFSLQKLIDLIASLKKTKDTRKKKKKKTNILFLVIVINHLHFRNYEIDGQSKINDKSTYFLELYFATLILVTILTDVDSCGSFLSVNIGLSFLTKLWRESCFLVIFDSLFFETFSN